VDRFQSFVDPGRKLEKKITDLTGITDEMLVGAPKIQEVLPKFMEFVGGRVLVAHNADFDTGFIRAECSRQGLTYAFTSADTLIFSQNLLQHLSKFKLDIVANALSLPEFNHHRAGDDALICGLIMARLMERLEQDHGITTLQQINPAMQGLRAGGRIKERQARHIILFAKNQVGLRNLYHLISDANLKYFKRVPRIPKSELLRLREGLIIGSACEAGELFQAILDKKSDDELKRIASFYDFLEIQPLANNRFMLGNEKYAAKTDEDLMEYNRKIVRLGEELGKMVVATGDVHFLNPEDEVYRHILLATKGFEDADKPMPLYFRTTDDMLREFAYLGEDKAYEVVVTNPNLIADMCETIRPVPHNLFAPAIENSVEDLKSLVYGKLHRLYGDNPPESFVKRVETELHDIISCHYDVIYMSAQRLVQNSLENGYLSKGQQIWDFSPYELLGGHFGGHTAGEEDMPNFIGSWWGEYKLKNELLSLSVELKENGEATYVYGLGNSEVYESFKGAWYKEGDGSINIIMYGGPDSFDGNEADSTEKYEFNGIFSWSCTDSNEMFLEHISGNSFLNGTDGKTFRFERIDEIY
jgi:DNA polymerase-3 subunit alpha (Gram-positive type)